MVRRFEDADFDGMMVHVHRVHGDPRDHFPVLKVHKEFLSLSAVELRYVVYAFDIQSPYVVYCDTLEERRMLAAVKSGLYEKGKKITKELEGIVRARNVNVNLAAIRYTLMVGNIDWVAMAAYETALYEELGKLSNAVDAGDYDKRKDIIDNAEKLRRLIKEMRQSLFRGDDPRLERDLQAMLDAPGLNLSPEDYAFMLSGGVV